MTNQYPIGKYEPKSFSQLQLDYWLNDIKFLPVELEKAVQNLDEFQLNSPYREGGWTIKQLVHHVADSHANAYIRFKLGFTENHPTIKPYNQDAWVLMDDVQTVPINTSLTLLHALHWRWYQAIKNKTKTDWLQNGVVHPEHNTTMTLWYLLGMYAWHGLHHTKQILNCRELNKWN